MNKTITGTQVPAANEAILAALRKVHNIASPASTAPEDLKRQRLGQETLGRLLTPPIGFSWEPFEIEGIPAAWVRPEGGHDRSKMILYCHGGGYTSGTLGYARLLASRMALATGYEVLAFQYRLAPEHPYPEALEDARLVWEHLMFLGWGAREIILAGDSAGGNLALELALDLRDADRMLPWRLVLFSPWTDMTASGESYEACRDRDPLLTREYIEAVREAYAPGADWAQAAYSPLFADLRGLPPTLIQVGGREILRDDSTRLHQNLQAAGVPAVLQAWPEMWHVFQMFPLKAAGEAMDQMARYLELLR
ncbi:MAG TPA: alpha/beta hydrolase [Candidatus Gemmiger excrementigallinarum]|uniref:Alpha/beta hydrolase n=1 Tax=Candidatus Gemmiger excrementigallinarum TaxID=2838609 RepID=A0A9D2ERD3_9FIRM|nr:alpha/beta hydrolase [Candidatus Gemmiger excrementigallinarum]